MPIVINKKTYFRTAEVCKKTGISRATLLRWLKAGIIKNPQRDRRGWRVFSESELASINKEINQIDRW